MSGEIESCKCENCKREGVIDSHQCCGECGNEMCSVCSTYCERWSCKVIICVNCVVTCKECETCYFCSENCRKRSFCGTVNGI